MKFTIVATLSVALLAVAAQAQQRPTNVFVQSSGLGLPTVPGHPELPSVTVSAGQNSLVGQGTIQFQSGKFAPPYGDNGNLTRGYVEFEPQYFQVGQPGAPYRPVCFFMFDQFETSNNAAVNMIDPMGTFAADYFLDDAGSWHVGLFFDYIGYTATKYTINFMCPPKGP